MRIIILVPTTIVWLCRVRHGRILIGSYHPNRKDPSFRSGLDARKWSVESIHFRKWILNVNTTQTTNVMAVVVADDDDDPQQEDW
jgi:hypothetical protein